MKKNSIADALRALTIPSLESETAEDSSIVTGDGDQTQTVTLKAADETPADSEGAPGEDEKITVKTVEVGERSDLESAETVSTDSPVTVAALAGDTKVSTEAAEGGESSIVTGDGDQTTTVKLEDAQTDQQEVEGEDKPGTAKTVEVDNGPKEEAATTEAKDSEVITTGDCEVSQESLLAVAAISAVIGLATGFAANKAAKLKNEYIDLAKQIKVKRAQLDHLITAAEAQARLELKKSKVSTESLSKEIEDLEGEKVNKTQRRVLAGYAGVLGGALFAAGSPIGAIAAAGMMSAILLNNIVAARKAKKELADLEAKLADKELEIIKLGIEAESKGQKVSQEAIDDMSAEILAAMVVSQEAIDEAVDAAAAFAAGAAGAAEAAAAAAGDAADAAPEVVAEAGVEVQAAEAAEDTAEVAAAVAEEQADAVDAAADEAAAGDAPDGDADAGEFAESADEDAEIASGEEELGELEDSITAGEEHVEKYENAEAALESLANAIESAQSTGGMTPQSAAFFNVGFESVGVFLTGKPFVNARGESPVPSMESYGTTMRRDKATEISMESVQEWLKKVWEVLKKTFAQIKEWLVKFFQAVFSQAERYKQRAVKYKAAASKVNTSSQGKSKTVNVSAGVAGKIHIGGEINRWDMHDLVELTKAAGTRNSEGTQAMMKMREALRTFATEITKGDDADFEKLTEAFIVSGGVQSDGSLRNAVFSEAFSSDGQEGYKTKVLPGGVELAIVSPASESESIYQRIQSALKGWRVVEIKQDAQVKTEVATPTGPQIAKICADVEATLNEVDKAKASFKAEALDLVDFQASGEISEQAAKQMRKVTSSYAKAVQNQTSGTSKLFKYIIGTCGAYLDFAAVALKEHGVNVTVAGQAGEAAANAGQAVKDGAGKAVDAAKNAVKGSEAAAA